MAKSSKPKHGGGATAAAEISDKSSGSKSNGVNIKKAKRTRKSIPRETPQQRSSMYRGVTRHRWTGRYEAHLWDKHSWNESQNKKGRQVYLGAYDDEEAAARAYDLAALKYWGQDTVLNFPLSTYEEEVKEMDGQSREEFIGSLRRKSSGFSRGVSKYRGVARHHHNGRWEARIGRVLGNKYLYLGTYATQEEAATAYDMAAVKYRGLNAVTNFDLSRYAAWLEPLQDNSDNAIIPKENIDDDTTQKHSQDIVLTFFRDQSESPTVTETTISSPNLRGDDATSPAMGIFMKSSMFKEMTYQTIVSDKSQSSTPELELESEPEPETRIVPIRSSFPDDIQTSFDFQDSSSFAEEHDIIFGNYDSFVSTVLEYGIDS